MMGSGVSWFAPTVRLLIMEGSHSSHPFRPNDFQAGGFTAAPPKKKNPSIGLGRVESNMNDAWNRQAVLKYIKVSHGFEWVANPFLPSNLSLSFLSARRQGPQEWDPGALGKQHDSCILGYAHPSWQVLKSPHIYIIRSNNDRYIYIISNNDIYIYNKI